MERTHRTSYRCHFRAHPSRAGQIFMLGITLLSFAALLIAFILLKDQRFFVNQEKNTLLGMKPYAIIATYQRADAARLYNDLAAEQSLGFSLAANALRGGFFNGDILENEDPLDVVEPSPCGSYLSNLWNNETQECYPDIEENIAVTFQLLHESKEEEYRFASFSTNNYRYSLQALDVGGNPLTVLSGTAQQPIGILITQEPPAPAPTELPPLNEQVSGAFAQITFPPGSNSRCVNTICMLHPDVEAHLRQTLTNLQGNYGSDHYDIIITSALRTNERQQQLYAECAPNCHGSVARPGSSPHEFGRAIDIRMIKNGAELPTGRGGYQYAYNTYKGFTPDQLMAHREVERIMCKEGWVRYRNEWWHFEYGTKRWAEAREQGRCVY